MLDILEISDLSLHLTQTGRPLLEHFSFTLGAGDRAVLIGEEGNGKSTLPVSYTHLTLPTTSIV